MIEVKNLCKAFKVAKRGGDMGAAVKSFFLGNIQNSKRLTM